MEPVVIALSIVIAGLLCLLAFCCSMLRQAQKDIKEIATEAILSTKSNSGIDFAQSQMMIHQAAKDRNAVMPPVIVPDRQMQPWSPYIEGPEGQRLEVLRPRVM